MAGFNFHVSEDFFRCALTMSHYPVRKHNGEEEHGLYMPAFFFFIEGGYLEGSMEREDQKSLPALTLFEVKRQ